MANEFFYCETFCRVRCRFLVIGSWLLVIGCWFLVVGSWLLVVGYWFLVVGCWLSVVGCGNMIWDQLFLTLETKN
ncbi:MAG: hypothetical protein DYG98_18160 [Haliscomenobacteraceae bacterium CHB4]|nr:hypothetical protein [Haliscomenobacteraceae bacterium CHB4]